MDEIASLKQQIKLLKKENAEKEKSFKRISYWTTIETTNQENTNPVLEQ